MVQKHIVIEEERTRKLSWIPSIGVLGVVGKRKGSEKRWIIGDLWSATSKVNPELAFNSTKNPGADMGEVDPKVIHSGVKPEPWGESSFPDTLGSCVWIKSEKGKTNYLR